MSPSPPPPTGGTALLALGSNLGNRRANLASALRDLGRDPGTRVIAVSSLYATEPIGLPGAPEFLNAAAKIETRRDPESLLELCLAIETQLGRVRSGRTESRPIDLDLLVYGSERRAGSRLTLPHPRMRERAFVLFPLAEIAPEYRLDGVPLAHWADRAGAVGIRKLDEPDWPPCLAPAADRT